ncbi:MAG: SOS response-associated peptidase [Acidimicrobiales bacterium]
MCGRVVAAASPGQIASCLGAMPSGSFSTGAVPRFNVAPGSPLPVVAEGSTGRTLGAMKWGLVPSWSRDPGARRPINARAEGIESNRLFGPALARRRCLVVVDGFYEWTRGSRRQPFYFHSPADSFLTLAGIWERSGSPGGESSVTVAIVTTEANPDVAEVHRRMPVVVGPQDWDRWLDRTLTDPAQLADVMTPAPAGTLDSHPVSFAVNRATNDGRHLLDPVDPAEISLIPGRGRAGPE